MSLFSAVNLKLHNLVTKQMYKWLTDYLSNSMEQVNEEKQQQKDRVRQIEEPVQIAFFIIWLLL